MAVNKEVYNELNHFLSAENVTLVAVSKTKPVNDIQALYELGQRDFGENYVQEITEKQPLLPPGIRWHFIGHLQTNKVKYIAPFVYMIHGIDSLKLLKEVNKQALKCNRVISVLLQIHIAKEETKFGLDENELQEVLQYAGGLKNVAIKGLMGMASFTSDEAEVRSEFKYLSSLYKKNNNLTSNPLPLTTLSMGMSGDYKIAIEEGSNMVRIGSLLFGARG
ncbi:MAG: YggS family pyridoxal phosphate-dependent enzyme [Chitinophagaceae bacterium]|nr:YggS family pyridoxal phosphate-dependent enzyme [Chitinophagaceae bacterium]